MFSCRLLPVLLLGAGILLSVALQPAIGAQVPASDEDLRITRIFYLQGMDKRDAITLLRSQLHVTQLAEVLGKEIIIITESAEKVDRSESLLRELEAVARAVDPHEPLSFARKPEGENETRIFRVDGVDTRVVVTVLRAIYQLRQLTELADKNAVVVSAPLPRLDAAEALLRELGLLVEEKEPSGS